MANILFLAHRLPYPPDRGDRIRSFHFVQHLAGRHAVSLAAVADQPVEEDHVEALRALCRSVDVGYVSSRARWLGALRALPTATPVTLPAFFSRPLQQTLARRLATERFDLIFIYCSSMAPYVVSGSPAPKVIDFIDADSEKWFDYARRTRSPLKALYWREGMLLRRYEQRVAQACAHALVTSEREAALLRRLAMTTPITAIPNGVTVPALERSERPRHQLVFTGVMDYWPNVDAMTYFADEIFPRIRAQVAEAELVIVGQRPAPKVERLGRRPGITVTGWVPSVGPYLEAAAVFVAPLRIARGIPNKILESMAAGVPVVATTAALAGLAAVPGRHVALADGPDEFAAQTVALLRDTQRRERLGRAARQFVLEHHAWDTHVARLERVLMDVMDRAPRRAERVSP